MPSPPCHLPPGVCDLGGLVKSVLLRMMLQPYGPQDLRRLTKQLKQVGSKQVPWWLTGTDCGWCPLAYSMPAGCASRLLAAHQDRPWSAPCQALEPQVPSSTHLPPPVHPQVAPHMSPFSFWLLRQCAAGCGTAGLTLSQQQAARAEAEKALSARIDRLFSEAQEQVWWG